MNATSLSRGLKKSFELLAGERSSGLSIRTYLSEFQLNWGKR
jgi:hypothetical protein